MYKVAIIGLKGLPSAGGAASVGESLISNLLPSSEYKFSVYLMKSKSNIKRLSSDNVRYIIVNDIFATRFGKVIAPLYYYIYSAFHSLFFSNYDLIHIHHRDSGFIFPFLSLRYKILVTLHGTRLTDKWQKYSVIFGLLDRLVVKYASIITSVSAIDHSKAYVGRYKPRYIPNGVEDYLQYRNRVEQNTNNKPIICFSAGRILETKGLHILLEAVMENNIDCDVWVIGNIDFESEYGLYIRHLLKNIDYRFFGMIYDKKQLLEIIGQSTLFVYPSYIEAMSMMLLEAASLRVPIICADITENHNIFDSSEVVFFKSQSTSDLSRKIRSALQDMRSMNNRSLIAKQKVMVNHDWNNIAKIYSDIYHELLQSRGISSSVQKL